MHVRFGYVAIALGVPEGSPNKTTTVKTLEKISDPDARISRLRRITRENLATTLRILKYNAAHQIHLYRFTSKTVPLATHPIAKDWDYISDANDELAEIGAFIRSHRMRVSAHPDHFTVLNTPQPEVFASSLRDLSYHAALFDAMGLDIGPQLVLHVGGLYQNKTASTKRFITGYNSLPPAIKKRLMLENDDKIYGTSDVLQLCQQLGIPMVLDLHHHNCISRDDPLPALWPQIADTWGGDRPKIHLSSPKSAKDFRSHADLVEVSDFLPFLKMAKELGVDFDVMIEAKQKDAAMFRLIAELAAVPGIKQVEGAAIEL